MHMVSTKPVNEVKNIISLENVSKSFQTENGDALILDDISLNIEENEFLVLFGAGQCGKTTLLKMLAGLETISEGQISVEDKPMTGF